MTDLTPSEDLAVEVLIARHRLGENFWTFEARHRPVLERLAAKGLVLVHNGTVQNTVRAELSQAGTEEFMVSHYVPPILRDAEEQWKPPDDHVVSVKPRDWQGIVIWPGGGQFPIQVEDYARSDSIGVFGEHMPPIQRAVLVARLRAVADLIENVPTTPPA